MRTIAYLTNRFPTPLEPYVMEEIVELRRRGVAVIPCSAQRLSDAYDGELKPWSAETLYIQPLQLSNSIKAAWLCLRRLPLLNEIIGRAVFRGCESPGRRLRAVVHTLLGAYFAVLLEKRGVRHIHVHHGYFSCWIAMVAARLRGITYSVTLHGSDLLLHKAYLDTKLENCEFCVTVSEFNRDYLLDHVSGIDSKKVFVRRMGVDVEYLARERPSGTPLAMLAVGRLHTVKNYGFLLEACARLKSGAHSFSCQIAGEGDQRPALERLIQSLGLKREVTLLGHLSRLQLDSAYANSNLMVLTSHSEGLPLVLMEAMVRGKIVLAPAITAIPELVTDGENGFLFREGSLDDFIGKLEMIRDYSPEFLHGIGRVARRTVLERFDRDVNLASFIDLLIERTINNAENEPHENFVLQQI